MLSAYPACFIKEETGCVIQKGESLQTKRTLTLKTGYDKMRTTGRTFIDENMMINCCFDGTSPVIFRIERIHYEQ